MHEGEISIPEAWQDKTMQLFVLPQPGGGQASFVITRDGETKAQSLEAYVDGQLLQAKNRLNQFRLIGREVLEVGHTPSVEIDYVWKAPEQVELRQRQAFAEWQNSYLIFTLTTRAADFEKHLVSWSEVLRSFTFRFLE